MKFFHKLFSSAKEAEEKQPGAGGLAVRVTRCAIQAGKQMGGPCVVLVVCSEDEGEPLVIGGALRSGSNKDIVRILERALEAARASGVAGPPSLPS